MTYAIVAAAVLLLLPLLVLRGATLRHCFVTQVSVLAFAATLAHLRLQIEPRLAVVTVAAAMLVVLALFLMHGTAVRWRASRAAILALVIYALTIPAMLLTPIDGDEPYYLLVTESIAHDHDLDLRNQYRDLARSATRRTDLKPQPGDPAGANGEQYSRHEPFLPLLLLPGFLAGGLPGAIGIIALFGALLVRSTIRLFEDEGLQDETIRVVFPFLVFGPPLLFYATRIWPEVPAAWCFVEVLRGVRQRRQLRWIGALLALIMLKLRFVLVGVALILRSKRPWLVLMLALPLAIVWLSSGSATNVHSWRELLPGVPSMYVRGLFGLLIDGMSGLAFQAPFFLLGVFALTRWRTMPPVFRTGMAAASIYVLYLLPRAEWHGGWSPPLRYITFLTPVLGLGAAVLVERSGRVRAWLPPIGLLSIATVIHGVTYPWRLFHIANGENPAGEWWSSLHHADFSRLFPSLIRPNAAAFAGGIVVLIALAAFASRRVGVPAMFVAPLLAAAVAAAIHFGPQPGSRIEFEDAHVRHSGGELFPEEYTVSRFLYAGGWIARTGDSLEFLARKGSSIVHYNSDSPALIELAGRAYELPAGPGGVIRVWLPQSGRVTLRCLAGAVNLDRMDHE